MSVGAVAEWAAFVVLAFIAIAGALGMATTMSMFRSGIFLMASFVGVAGLFILLSADLLGLLQIMMYIGGMLVMILFMVLFSHDPGGSMMAGMDMSLVERLFSLGLSSGTAEMDHGDMDATGGMEAMGGAGGMDHSEMDHGEMGDMAGMDHGDMGDMGDMAGMGHGEMDMSMTTPMKRYAAGLAVAVGAGLVALLVLRPAWPISSVTPDPDSARMVGGLLMSKYMMAFEGAGLLILVGIFGAVLLARPGRYPDRDARDEYVTADEPPPPIEEDAPPQGEGKERVAAARSLSVLEAHVDEEDGA